MICPICNENVQIVPQKEMPCECCKSIIFQDENLNARVIESRVFFSTSNFISGLLFLFGIPITIAVFPFDGWNFLFLGLMFFVIPVLLILQQLIFLRSNIFQSSTDLYHAFRTGRLKYYDIGSKFLVYSVMFVPVFGIGIIIFGLIF